jgi:hypothetical protein
VADAQHPVEPVVDLVHDVTVPGKRGRACGQLAMRASLSHLQDVADGKLPLHCNGCFKLLTLDQVTGDEPFVPAYQPPAGARR